MVTARLDWEYVRSLIENQTGPVLVAEPITEGLNSEIAVVVHTSLGATFVKGLRSDHRRVWTQQREAEINPYVLTVTPRLRWHVETDGWNLLGFERVNGRRVDYSPGSPDLPKVVHVMRRLAEIPCPGLPLKSAPQRWASYTHDPELFTGDQLLHTEWSPGNVLINDTAHLVDWAWPTRGAAWIDPACWVVWLVASGHSPQSAQDWQRSSPPFVWRPWKPSMRSRGCRLPCGTGSRTTTRNRGQNASRTPPGSGPSIAARQPATERANVREHRLRTGYPPLRAPHHPR